MWNCKCGNTCSDESHFCAKCGAKKSEFENIQDCQWFYYDDKNRVGPLSFEEMKEAITSGKIFADSLVWHQGLDEWKKASETSLKQILTISSPAIPLNKISDKKLWMLSLIPGISFIIYDLFASIASFLLYSTSLFPRVIFEPLIGILLLLSLFLLFVLPRILLIVSDSKYLKLSGYPLPRWAYLGILFIPFYIFVRARRSTKNYIPLIFWVLFILLGILFFKLFSQILNFYTVTLLF